MTTNLNPRIDTVVSADIKPLEDSLASGRKSLGDFEKDANKAGDSSGRLAEGAGKASGALSGLRDGLTDAADAAARHAGASEQLTAALRVLPVGLGAVAVGVAGVVAASIAGRRETEGYAQALIMTGHAAGVSAGGLQALARDLADSADATQRAAAAAVTALAKTGKVGAEAMGEASEAVLRMSEAGVQGIAESVRAFERLADEPAKASRALNEELNYLTLEVYRNIASLDEQGRSSEAAAAAQSAYAEAMSARAQEIEGRLGSLERAWKSLGGAASWAWDKMLDAGRAKDTAALLDSVREDIRRGTVDAYGGEDGAMAAFLRLQQQLVTETEIAQQKAKQNESEQAAIELRDLAAAGMSRQEQKQRDINQAVEIYRKALGEGARSQEEQLKIAADYERTMASIERKYEEKTRKSPVSKLKEEVSELDRLLSKLDGKEFELDANYVKNVELLIKGWKSGALSLEQYNVYFSAYVAMQPGAVKAAKELEQAQAALNRSMGSLVSTEQKHAESVGKTNEKLRDEISALNAGSEGAADYAAQKLEMAAASEMATAEAIESSVALWEEAGVLPSVIAGYEALAEAKRRSAEGMFEQASLTREKSRLETSTRYWKKFSDDIERSLTDSLFRAFESGDSFGEAFVKSLQNTLKTTVLKLAVNFTMDLGKQLLGAGLNWITGGSASSGLGSALGLASNASSAWNAVSTLSSAYNALATGAGALPGTVNLASGVGYLGGDSIGALIKMNPQWGATVAPGATGATGSALGSLGTAAQTIGLVSIPFIIGGLIDKFGGGDKYQTGVALQGVFGKDQKGGFDGIVGENYSVTSGWFHGGRDTVEYTDVDISVRDMLSILAGRGSDKADGILRGKITDEQYQKALSQVGIVVGETLVKTSLEDNPLAMSKRVGKPYQEDGKTYVDIIAPVFKTAAEMTEDEIRSKWTELVDLNSWKKIDWESNKGSGYKNRLTQYGENPDYKPRGDGWDALSTGGAALQEHLNRLNFDQGEFGEYLVSTNIQVYDFLSESLDKIYESTISAYRTLGEQLGATDIEAILDSYTGNINIQNVTGLEQLLNGAAQQLNEGIGKAIFPIIDEIRAATGEAGTWADTFARVSGEAAAIGAAFKDLGLTMHNSGIANQLLATSVALTTAFGGLEGLNAALTSYYDNYYTAEEKRARTLKQLGDALRQGGLEITDSRLGEMSRAEFRSLYESIVETSGAAAPAAIAMLQMQGAFAQLTVAARESSQEMRISSARDALKRSVDAEKERITADADSRISALQAGIDESMQAIDAARKSVSTLTSIFSAIENGVSRLRAVGDAAGTMLKARAYIDMSLALSKSGVVPDQAKLSDAISTVASDTSRAYASIAEFEYAQLVQASKLDALGNEIGKQKSVADMQLEALEGANRFAEEQIRAIEKSASNQVAALDSLLTQFSGQIDALNGINTGVLSVRDAVAEMNTAISGLASALNKPAPAPVSAPSSSGSSAVSGGGASSSLNGGYTIAGNTLIFPGGGTHTVNAGSTAAAQAALINAYGLVPSGNGTYVRTRAAGGYTPPGLTLVGEEGPELVNFKQPGMVYTAAQTRNLMGGADSAIAAELRALREVNARLEARLAAIEKNTRDTHDLTYRVTEGGNVMRTVAA